MATNYKTPGVYIQEPDSFPPSIVGVDTAVPAFIGYTEFALGNDKRDLHMIPQKINSLAEFQSMFGGGYTEQYYLSSTPLPTTSADFSWGKVSLDGTTSYYLVEVGNTNFNLYNSMRLFYANGGGTCYVCSCGLYETPATPAVEAKAAVAAQPAVPAVPASGDTPAVPAKPAVPAQPAVAAVPAQPAVVNKPDVSALTDALAVVGTITGPTMLVIPDAVLVDTQANFNALAVAMLQQCQDKGDRMALLDVYGTDKVVKGDFDDTIDAFRTGLSGAPTGALRYGAAYFPSLVTSIVSSGDLDMTNFATGATDTDANGATLIAALTAVIAAAYPLAPTPPATGGTGGTGGTDSGGADSGGTGGSGTGTAVAVAAPKGQQIIDNYIKMIGKSVANSTQQVPGGARPLTHRALTDALVAMVPGFGKLLEAIAATQSVLPPSGAMAGIWTTNDTYNGVWNAPANVGIAGLIQPSLPISSDQQEDLNVPLSGLSVNAIRSFPARGNLVWGARTLDGLSNDWRYIQVRRTMIYVEQSVKDALQRQVFKPNTAQTWVTVTSMIESFLHGLWASGGLMGSAPSEAYSVLCGMGSTMTPDDVLNGIMRVQITLQMVHPAEFIELTFKQQMLGGA